MTAMFQKVGGSGVQVDGEGSVVYLERVDPVTHQSEVFSMCKLKTMEYRFLRKAREKIKKSIRRKGGETKILNEFEKECISLMDDFPEEMKGSLPEIKYYKEMLSTMLDIVAKNSIPIQVMEKSFINFLVLGQKCHDEKREPTKEEIELIIAFKATDEDGELKAVLNEESSGISEANIVVLDVPGLFDVASSITNLKSKGYRIKFDFGEKKCPKKTLRFINISKESINAKKLKPYTYLIVPSVESVANMDQEKLKQSCKNRLCAMFSKVSGMDDESEEHKLIKEYLQSAVNNIDKQTNIETCVDLSLVKITRVKDVHKKFILHPSKDQTWDEALIKEIGKIEAYHASKV
jgi:hypothetical protein